MPPRSLDDDLLRRTVIEALRLRKTTVSILRKEIPRRKGAQRMRLLLDDLEDLPIARCRSNAEGQALYRLKKKDRRIPEVNEIVAGYEADLVDFERKEITEIDGGAFHADAALDEQKNRAWRGDGFTVHRRPSDDAYDPDAPW
jgi:hypothetical protein